MVGAIKFLRYQMLSYWRRAFSVREKFDRYSGFLIIVVLFVLFQYTAFISNTARSFSLGNTEKFYVILLIIFLSWAVPIIENQELQLQTQEFIFLPPGKNQFALLNIFRIFNLPTSVIPIFICLAAIYPLIFMPNRFAAIVFVLSYSLASGFLLFAIVNLLKSSLVRRFVFLAIIFIAALFLNEEMPIYTNNFLTAISSFSSEFLTDLDMFRSCLLAGFLLSASFVFAFISSRYRKNTNSQFKPTLLSKRIPEITLPFLYFELVRKDFCDNWKSFDAWIGFLISVIYSILLYPTGISGIGISFSIIVSMNGILAFNIFGFEKPAGIERLSLFPISNRRVFETKNKSFALVILSQTFFLFPIILLLFGLVPFVISLLKMASITLLYTAWGNNLSINYPFKMRFFQVSFGGSLPAMTYGIIFISIFIIAPDFLPTENLYVKLVAHVALFGFSFFVYRIFLRKSSLNLPHQWETIKQRIK